MGAHVMAGGLPTYHEVHGDGDPLVLLHGGLATVESWGAQIPALAGHYRVHVPERRGHGRTPDVEGPITYAAMAGDTIGYLEALGLRRAHLVGWSDGAVVAVLVALRRPDLVGKLVLIGQFFNRDGERPESRAMTEAWAAEPPREFRMFYDPYSPDGPAHFPVVFAKMMRLWREEPDLDLAELAAIAAPTLVMQGDDDVVTVEHSAAVARAVPDAQLAVVPGASHALPLERPELVNRLILEFLAPGRPARLMPLTH
ncbi:alpha/beta fold hydrolase [Actinomadura scrupuli]|uniref:alpha/beta fold hydrolase n=1 Tax=Actinomadura scrupuli TaxID=559629 RepID=UPI003D9549DA